MTNVRHGRRRSNPTSSPAADASSASPSPAEGWFKLANSVIDNGTLARLKASSVKVLLVLQRYVNTEILERDGKAVSWPGRATIARLAGISLRAVDRAVDDLERSGLVIAVTPGGGRVSTTYHVTIYPTRTSVSPVSPVTPLQCHQRHGTRVTDDTRSRQEKQTNQQHQDAGDAVSIEVVQSLEGEGIDRPAAIKLAREGATLQHVRDAVLSANAKPNLRNRAGFIVDAVTHRRPLSDAARANLASEVNAEAERQANARRREQQERQRRREEAAQEMLAQLKGDELQRHIKAVLDAEPDTDRRERLAKLDPCLGNALRDKLIARFASIIDRPVTQTATG